MSEWIVRPATTADYHQWRDVYEQVATEGRWIGGEQAPPHEVMRPRFDANVEAPDRLTLVVEAEDSVVGGLLADYSRPGVIHFGMQLLDGWRGRGIGSALMQACIDWANEQGGHKITLEVWPHNARAIALYERFGFVTEGRLRRHYRRRSGALWDSLVMGLVLDDSSPGSPFPDAVGS